MSTDFMNTPISWLDWTGLHMSPWKLIGLTGTLLFGGRWLVQFVASRRQGKPVMPRAFWYMSIAGSLMALSYFVFSHKQDAVGIVQNLFPAFTACYSLYLDIRHRGWRRNKITLRQGSPDRGVRVRSRVKRSVPAARLSGAEERR